MKIWSNRHSINLVEWFCLNVKFSVLVFLILKISQMSKLSFISTNFAMDFLLRVDLTPLVSDFYIKKKIKTTGEDNAFILTNMQIFSSSKIALSSVSVLALDGFIRIYWSSSSLISLKNKKWSVFQLCFYLFYLSSI